MSRSGASHVIGLGERSCRSDCQNCSVTGSCFEGCHFVEGSCFERCSRFGSWLVRLGLFRKWLLVVVRIDCCRQIQRFVVYLLGLLMVC